MQRAGSVLAIGPSAVEWRGDALEIRIDEVTAPLPSRIRGVVRVQPAALTDRAFALDSAGRHRWTPIAPCARVEVELERPALRWRGEGYLDANAGDEPLEAAFSAWTWSRARVHDGAVLLYDTAQRDGERHSLALALDARGELREFAPPPVLALPPTGWRIPRETRTDIGTIAAVAQTLEDTPFYARSIVTGKLRGEPVTAMHESLSLDRFRSRWVQALLPFRTPRALR